MKTYRQSITVRFRDADPGGIMFFANIYRFAHDVFEGFIEQLGVPWAEWFANPELAVPIRHAEADYRKPLRPSESYDVAVGVEHIGDSSFKLKYVFSQNGAVHCEVRTAHTFFNIKSASKMAIPPQIRSRLEPYLQQSLIDK